MFLKLHRVLLLGLIFIALFSCGTVAYGADLEAYKAKADEIKTEISALEVEVEACQKNKDFAHQLAQYARRIGADEEDSAIVRARSIWTFNDEREEELQKKLDLLYKELEEYDFYANMSYIGDFKLTGYCACKKCCGKSPSNPNYGITAMGTRATEGRTIAMDKRFPFGTKVYIEGLGVRIVEDRGGAIKGSRIDVYATTHSGCYAPEFNRIAKVYVIND